MKSFFIGICGISGSGKSKLADGLEERGLVKRFRFDAYYRPLEDCPTLEDGSPNWDHPDSLFLDHLYHDLLALKEGKTIDKPVYERKIHKRVGTVLYEPAPVILVEGIFAFANEYIREVFDLKLWLEVPEELAFKRRLSRQPNYDPEYHFHVVLPAGRTYVSAYRNQADHTFNGLLAPEVILEEAVEVLKNAIPTDV